MSVSSRVPISGSERKPVTGATEIGPVDPREKFEVTVVLRPNPSSRKNPPLESGSPKKRSYLTREQFTATTGASSSDINAVSKFAESHGLRVVEASSSKRSVILSGTYSQFREAFGVELKKFRHPENRDITYRGRTGPIYVPSNLSQIIVAVLGLDNRPQARAHKRPVRPRVSGTSSYTPPQLAGIYSFPTGLDGTGQCIGIIELGGGTTQADLSSYFSGLGITMPKVVTVPVDGAKDAATGDPTGPDGEVMLDIEVAGSIAPGSVLAVYFAPNTDQGFFDAVSSAVHDSQNKPSVVSISWGGSEDSWTTQGLQSINQALSDASTMGVTVCVAAGDGGSSDGQTDGLSHVDFPASSPFVLACGGTRLVSAPATGPPNERVWNDEPGGGATGGGVSDVFSLPGWQAGAKVPPSANPGGKTGRGVPDVSGNADPETGYNVRIDGQNTVLGGTSAVAPLWAGLLTLINQKLGRPVGFTNTNLYQNYNSLGDFYDVTTGSNGAYSAGPGWDPCTGLGTPDGAKILNVLSQ
jgi:kumamolisin